MQADIYWLQTDPCQTRQSVYI